MPVILKQFIKKLIPNRILSWHYDNGYVIERQAYADGMKYITENHNSAKKMKVAFVLNFPETFNSVRTVYEQFVKKNIECCFFCVPKMSENSENGMIFEKNNSAYDFCVSNNIRSVNTYDEKNDMWVDMKEYAPDYVFYIRPYNGELPEQYKSTTTCRYAKVCFVPYGYILTKSSEGGAASIVYSREFLLTTYVCFFTSEYSKREVIHSMENTYKNKSHKYEYLGFPRFDLAGKADRNKVKDTILWIPRWTLPDAGNDYMKGTFLLYIEPFLEYMKHNSDKNLIIRCHPLMFRRYLEKGVMTQEEIDKLNEIVDSMHNVCFDRNKDYINTFDKSDIMVADISSLMMEYFITEKPIIYCDLPINFIDEAVKMDDTLYHANSWSEIQECLTKLFDNNDDKYICRKKAVDDMLNGCNRNIGGLIADYILNDYNC